MQTAGSVIRQYRHVGDEPFWSVAELLPERELRRLQERRLLRQVRYVYERNPFYRAKWREAGVHPDDIRSLDDVVKLPITTKEEILQSQEERPPYGMMLCEGIPEDAIVRIALTSGTTNRPVRIPFTADDYFENWVEGVARSLWAAGVRPGDRVHCAFGFTPFIGLAGAYDACEHFIGATVIPGGSWDTRTRIRMIRELGVTVLMGTPTYLLHLGRSAERDGVDPRSLGLRVIFSTGEPGILSAPNTGRRLKELFGAAFVGEFSGTQETQYFAWTCREGGGHLNEDQVLFEVLDPDTLAPVPPGTPGLLVVTDLVGRTHPLIRFRTGDLVAGIRPSDCPCGRTLALFQGFLGRTGDVVKIRGVSVSVSAVENAVRGNPYLSDNYQIVLETNPASGMDEVRVEAEARPDVPREAWPGVQAELEAALRSLFFVAIGVRLLEPGTLPTYELKAKRFFDRRNRPD